MSSSGRVVQITTQAQRAGPVVNQTLARLDRAPIFVSDDEEDSDDADYQGEADKYNSTVAAHSSLHFSSDDR